MSGAKIVVLYPAPRDVSAFERAYVHEHAPMVTPQNFKGLTKFVASKIVGTPDGSAHRPSIASLNFTFHRWQHSRRPLALLRHNRLSRTRFPFRPAARLFF
jgi:hypothetical protein